MTKKIDTLLDKLPSNLETLLHNSGMKKGEFEDFFGLSQGILAKYVSGAVVPKTYLLAQISEHFKISLDSLIFGNLKRSTGRYDSFEDNHSINVKEVKEWGENAVQLDETIFDDPEQLLKFFRFISSNHARLAEDPIYLTHMERVTQSLKNIKKLEELKKRVGN